MKEKMGLVLSGGGAKGAYHVGVVRALAEAQIGLSAISGASIGALNGAIVASAASLAEAACKLENLWHTLAEESPFEDNAPSLLRAMEALGLEARPSLRNAAILAKEISNNLVSTLKSPETEALADNGKIKRLMDEYISIDALSRGIPLYVSVFPNRGYLESVLDSSLAALGIKDNSKSEFLHVQALPEEDCKKALLASAAIPFLFHAQEIDGERYVDGGMGGLFSSQGNTPIEPLLEIGCDTLIVTSLSDHSRWSRQKYPNARLIGIDRVEPIHRNPVLPEVFDILSFRPRHIASWIEQGYEDTVRCIRGGQFD